jgi:hypothetical protein
MGVRDRCAVRHDGGEFSQHLIQTRHDRVR